MSIKSIPNGYEDEVVNDTERHLKPKVRRSSMSVGYYQLRTKKAG